MNGKFIAEEMKPIRNKNTESRNFAVFLLVYISVDQEPWNNQDRYIIKGGKPMFGRKEYEWERMNWEERLTGCN